MRRVVLDANVLMSAVINPRGTPAQILAAWRAGRVAVVLSTAILEEVDRVLQYPKVAKFHQWSEERRRLFVEDLAHLARRTPGIRQIAAVAADPTDNRYLECAVEGEAEFLVTGDQHLLGLGSYEGIPIVTPARFWQLLASESEVLLARVRFRPATAADAPRLLAFYQESGYAGGIMPTDVVILAEEEDRILGALRLCEEHGVLVLRGMRVHAAWQCQGIGTRLLHLANERMGEQTCYALPYPHLEAFYGRIGFVKVRPEEVPPFLLARWTEYRDRGVDTLLMKKSAPPASE